MSRASAYVVTPRGRRLGEMVYEGTSDVLMPDVFPTAAEALAHSRAPGRDEWARHERCDHAGDEAYAYSDYGGGFWWPVRYCGRCHVVQGPLDCDDDMYDDLGDDWPKDGEPPIDGGTSPAGLLPAPRAKEEKR